MAITLLDLLQEFSDRRGLDKPQIVMGSTDDGVQQLRALANEVVSDITNRGTSWALLQKEAVFTSVAGDDQGAITTIAPYGFKRLILETAYDRTTRRQLFGPRNAQRWQESKALPTTGPFYSYRIWNGHLFFQPDLPADHTIAFEYASDMAILALDGLTWKRRFSDDADSFQLDEEVLLAGLNAKWRREKGLSYIEEKAKFEQMLNQLSTNEPTKGVINMANSHDHDLRPGIFVPSGNWNV